MVRRFFKDIFPWILLILFFVSGLAMAFVIGQGLRHGSVKSAPAATEAGGGGAASD